MFATQVMNADPDLLDRLFDDYLGTIGAASPEMARFLFGHVPVEVFDRIFSGRDSDSRGGLMWLMHLSGYFGGRWLRGEIEQAQPDAMLNLVNIVPGEEKFQATMERAGAALTAADADDATVLAYAHASLLDTPAPNEGGQPVPGLTDSFGYNLGYLLEILAACTGETPQTLAAKYTQYGSLKVDTGEAVVETLRPVQARYHELMTDRGQLQSLLRIGADKARSVASATLARAQRSIGMLPA